MCTLDVVFMWYCLFLGMGAGGVVGYFIGREKNPTLRGSRISTDLINENTRLKAMLDRRNK